MFFSGNPPGGDEDGLDKWTVDGGDCNGMENSTSGHPQAMVFSQSVNIMTDSGFPNFNLWKTSKIDCTGLGIVHQ